MRGDTTMSEKNHNIDYNAASDMYRPEQIKKLIVVEAPPPSRKKYIYISSPLKNFEDIEDDTSLPATIFYHYFSKVPRNDQEYREMLERLQKMKIFIVDMYPEPIQVRNNKRNKEIIKQAIPSLKTRLQESRDIDTDKIDEIIFLMPRSGYTRIIRKHFHNAHVIRWKKFRMTREEAS